MKWQQQLFRLAVLLAASLSVVAFSQDPPHIYTTYEACEAALKAGRGYYEPSFFGDRNKAPSRPVAVTRGLEADACVHLKVAGGGAMRWVPQKAGTIYDFDNEGKPIRRKDCGNDAEEIRYPPAAPAQPAAPATPSVCPTQAGATQGGPFAVDPTLATFWRQGEWLYAAPRNEDGDVVPTGAVFETKQERDVRFELVAGDTFRVRLSDVETAGLGNLVWLEESTRLYSTFGSSGNKLLDLPEEILKFLVIVPNRRTYIDWTEPGGKEELRAVWPYLADDMIARGICPWDYGATQLDFSGRYGARLMYFGGDGLYIVPIKPLEITEAR